MSWRSCSRFQERSAHSSLAPMLSVALTHRNLSKSTTHICVKRPGERISHVDARAAILEVSNRKIPRSSALSKVTGCVFSRFCTPCSLARGSMAPTPISFCSNASKCLGLLLAVCQQHAKRAHHLRCRRVLVSPRGTGHLAILQGQVPLSLLFMHHRLRLFFRRACGICCRQMAAGATTLAACLEGAYTCLSPHLAPCTGVQAAPINRLFFRLL
jgi:hypothetical protein